MGCSRPEWRSWSEAPAGSWSAAQRRRGAGSASSRRSRARQSAEQPGQHQSQSGAPAECAAAGSMKRRRRSHHQVMAEMSPPGWRLPEESRHGKFGQPNQHIEDGHERPEYPMNDHALAARLATEAGQLLLGVRDEFADADASERKAAGDKRSHDFLMEALVRERPDDAVLSEEGADDPVRLRSERVWIVDPLDGTREFSELGRDDWAVHVALWQAGELIAGAVALPAQGITLATPDVDAPPDAPAKPRIVVSRTRPPAIALAVRDALDGILVEMGSAGAQG